MKEKAEKKVTVTGCPEPKSTITKDTAMNRVAMLGVNHKYILGDILICVTNPKTQNRAAQSLALLDWLEKNGLKQKNHRYDAVEAMKAVEMLDAAGYFVASGKAQNGKEAK